MSRIEKCEVCGRDMRIGSDMDIHGTGWFNEATREEIYVHNDCDEEVGSMPASNNKE